MGKNLGSLVKETENNEKVENEYGICDYCGTPLLREHFIGSYGGKYCNKDCHLMFTED